MEYVVACVAEEGVVACAAVDVVVAIHAVQDIGRGGADNAVAQRIADALDRGALEVEVLNVIGQRVACEVADGDCVEAFTGEFSDRVADVVDVVMVITRAASHGVCARFTLEYVVACVAEEGVVAEPSTHCVRAHSSSDLVVVGHSRIQQHRRGITSTAYYHLRCTAPRCVDDSTVGTNYPIQQQPCGVGGCRQGAHMCGAYLVGAERAVVDTNVADRSVDGVENDIATAVAVECGARKESTAAAFQNTV